MYYKSWRTWLFIAYLMIIVYLSLKTGSELAWALRFFKYDKAIHFMEYAGLGFLLVNMIMLHPMKKKHWYLTLLFLLLFPILDESLQHFTPGRYTEIYDGLIDILGGVSGAYIRKKI